MPFARPSSSPSGQSNTSSDHYGSLGTPAKLATPWDASSLEKQLASMKEEAAASSASSLSSSPARPHLSSLPRSMPSPNLNGMTPSHNTIASPDSPAMSSSSSTSSPPEQYFTSHRALKQRLFQMSDDEDEDAKVSPVANTSSDTEGPSAYHSRFRTDRNAPIRQSISALSGVTVIGRGSLSSKRDSQGSISTIGLHRNSIEDGRPVSMSRTQSDNVTAPLQSKRSSSPSRLQTAQAGPIDMGSALQLLQMYPRSASPPANFDNDIAPPPRSRSVSPTAVSPRSQQSVLLPAPAEGGSRPVRRHSRSSMASELAFSPVPANLIMTTPTSAASCPEQRSALPSLLDGSTTLNDHELHQDPSSSSSSGFPFSPASLSDATPSRTLPATESNEGDSPQSRRTMPSSRSVSTNDLAHIMRSFSSRSRKATGRRRSTQGQPLQEEEGSSIQPRVPVSTSAEPLRRGTRGSRHPSGSGNLQELIRQKRRMASGPFHNTVSTRTSGTTSPILASGAQSPVLNAPTETSPWDSVTQRRARSRRNSAASTGLHLSIAANGFEEARLRALRGMGDVVMTPSVEEWKLLGLHESLNDRNGSDSSGSESDTSSSESSQAGHESDDLPSRYEKQPDQANENTNTDSVYRPRVGSITTFNQYYGSAPPTESSSANAVGRKRNDDNSSSAPILSRSSSRTLGHSPKKRNFKDTGSEADTSSAVDDDSGSDNEAPVVRNSNRNSLPTLSRQSLSMPTGTHIPGLASIRQEDEENKQTPEVSERTPNISNGTVHASLPASPALGLSPSRPSSPIALALGGPVDPRAYSAVTGLRNINSFAVQGEAGKGAYGLVRKVREKGPDGRPVGPNLMLKYIVKQRILADAYKRHKVLGVIPMEIHVLDFIRRIYRGPGHPARDPISNVKRMHGIFPPTAPATADQAANQTLYGHPNLCQMLDFFEDAENYYLVMSCFGNGQDLFDYVDAAPMGLTVTESKSFLTQIVDAVAFLHSHGVVHRDIKDENIILDGKGGVQLIDFGSAAYIKEGKPYFDTFSGTLDFASPEVLRGERYGGKETDIWALGVLAYVILCGECPFWSSEESLAGLHTGCRSEAALQAKADSPDVITELKASKSDIDAQDAVDFVHQCLQVHARDRPPAVQLRKHRFICGKQGWVGTRGWESLDGYVSAASGFDSA